MKKNILILMAFALLFSVACNKADDEDVGQPGEITITTSIDGNVVTYTATADNAIKFIWDLGNGETPEGVTVTGTYAFPGEYDVKCTAKGRDLDRVKTIKVDVAQGDPTVFNEVNKTLCGYDDATGESTTIWMWADGAKIMGDGPRVGDVDTVYFNPIDDSWWQNGVGELPEDGLDDEYSFKLDKSMTFENNFGAAFMVNWAWAATRGYAIPDIWDDYAYAGYNSGSSPAVASWSVRHIANINDTLQFETNINGTMMEGAYVIELTNNAYMGLEAAGSEYQILKLTQDTLWIRFDNTFPTDLSMYDPADLESEGVTPGEPDETYLKLVRKQ